MSKGRFSCEKCGHLAGVMYSRPSDEGIIRRLYCKDDTCGHRWTGAPDSSPLDPVNAAKYAKKMAKYDRLLKALDQQPMTAEEICAKFSVSQRDVYDVLLYFKQKKKIHVGDRLRPTGRGGWIAVYYPGDGVDVPIPPAMTREEVNQRARELRRARYLAEQERLAAAMDSDHDPIADIEAARKARIAAKIKPFRDPAVAALFGNYAYFTIDRRQENGLGQTEKVLRALGRHIERSPSQAEQRHVR